MPPLLAYLKEPVAERSAMPARVIERFGLMPPQSHLSEGQRIAVARYILSVADTAHVRPRSGEDPPRR